MSAQQAVTAATTVVMAGPQILAASPLLFVTMTSTGVLFFNLCGCFMGDNLYGQTSRSIGWLLNRPMRVVEVVINSLVFSPITKVTGFPLLINATLEQTN